MIVLFIVAVAGAVTLLYYWSQTVSATKQDLKGQRQLAGASEGRAQFLVNETRLLWEQLLLEGALPLPPERHQLAFELHLLMPYLWQTDTNPFYINELQLKAGPLVKSINDPVINRLWARGTLESINKIPLTLAGQLSDPHYDPEKGVVRQHDKWYPSQVLWSEQ